MATKERLKHIEVNHGRDERGSRIGYDRKRGNRITWGFDLATEKVVVDRVDPDENAARHGSLDATRRDAASLAAELNKTMHPTRLRVHFGCP